ncbi:flagellar M-ring protein FliF [Sphingobium boeckii]|uniref:Flagellar M-ring protein n=2 Tax=Sphingobium boeckii TaxID=1082345 RepID=A0A7W9AGU9_9SPHN|nr:flagellar M-ring protein FliF [Sphingobium boeckii]
MIAALGPRRLMIMGGVALALLLGIGALAMQASSSSSEMGFLYTDLDPDSAKTITEKLKGQGVPFELSSDGTAITAPVDKLPELRMALASERLGGKIGYGVLDAEEPFGVSSSRARMNETRAIEGELSRSIESLERVNKARVHIVMPERAMFAAEARKATASITLNTRGKLPREAIQSIRYLVAAAVPELSPESVSIVDQAGNLLARAGDEGSAGASDVEERQAASEARLRSQIEAMIEPIVGQGKVRAEVAVVLDREQTRKEAEVFDPDTQVIAHQVTVESSDQNDENGAGAEGVTVGAQLPDNEGDIAGTGGETRRSARNESSEDTTFQNSRTHTVSVSAPGKIDRVTVAVMVDGGAKGLPPPQIQRLTRLVENAVGFDAERGDSVVVETMPFAAPGDVDGESDGLPLGLTPGNILNLVELLVLIGAALFAVRMFRPKAIVPDVAPALLAEEIDPEQAALEDRAAEGDPEAIQMLETMRDEIPLLDQEIALAQVDGRIRLSALKRIGDTIAASPAESVSVIRQWMNA